MKNFCLIILFFATVTDLWSQAEPIPPSGNTDNQLVTTLLWDVSKCEVSSDSIHKVDLVLDRPITDTIKVCTTDVMNYYVTGENLRNVKKINWQVEKGIIKDQYDNVAFIYWEEEIADRIKIEITFQDSSVGLYYVQVQAKSSININVPAFNSIQLTYDTAGNQVLRNFIYLAARPSDPSSLHQQLSTAEMFAQSDEEDVLYYPNPVKQELTIKWMEKGNADMETIEVYDLNGRIIKTLSNQNQVDTALINFDSYPVGIYTIQLLYTGGVVKTLKIVKQD